MKLFRSLVLSIAYGLAMVSPLQAIDSKDPLRIYVDADFTISNTVAISIMMGLETALSTGDGSLAGHPVEVVAVDNRSTPKRSKFNLTKFLKDPNAIAVVGGKQSPPYLNNLDFINDSNIPLLLAWSAAAPITRGAEGPDNFVFRLSVDDSQAGPFLLQKAVTMGCERTALYLIDTAWGRANQRTIRAASEAAGVHPIVTEIVSPEIGPTSAESLAESVASLNPDCAIGVLTHSAGAEIISAFHRANVKVRFLSHWGIIGHKFVETVSAEARDYVGLTVLQTCGLEQERLSNPILREAITEANLEEQGLRGLPAPAGFVHGYDLGLILREAVAQASATDLWSSGPAGRRLALRDAVETLQSPVKGILKSYDPPFSPVSPSTRDGHEALGREDLCFARFDGDGTLVSLSGG